MNHPSVNQSRFIIISASLAFLSVVGGVAHTLNSHRIAKESEKPKQTFIFDHELDVLFRDGQREGRIDLNPRTRI